MTNISAWPKIIKKEKVGSSVLIDGRPIHEPIRIDGKLINQEQEFIMLPFDEYQITNLLGLMKRSPHLANGDWFNEILSLMIVAIEMYGIDLVKCNNFGDTFDLNLLKQGRFV